MTENQVSAAQANGSSGGEVPAALDDIPMPEQKKSAAWEKAQQALQSICSKEGGAEPPAGQSAIQGFMMKQYPWMPQSSFPWTGGPAPRWTPPPQLTRPPVYGGGGFTNYPPPNAQWLGTTGSFQPAAKQGRGAIRVGQAPAGVSTNFASAAASAAPAAAAAAARGAQKMRFNWRGRGAFSARGGAPKISGANTLPLGYKGEDGSAASDVVSAGVADGRTTPVQQSPLAAAAAAAAKNDTTVPEGVKAYIERAYLACTCESDRGRVEMALKEKLMPLLRSGTAWRVDWTKEPLPTDANFTMTPPKFVDGAVGEEGASPTSSWIPAAVLKRMQHQGRGGKQRGAARGVGRNVFAGQRGGRGRFRTVEDRCDDDVGTKRRRRDSGDRSEGRSSYRSRSRSRGRSPSGSRSPGSSSGAARRPSAARFDRLQSTNSRQAADRPRALEGLRTGKKGKAAGGASMSIQEAGKLALVRAQRARRFAADGSAAARRRAPAAVVASHIRRPRVDLDDDVSSDAYYSLSYSPAGQTDELDLSKFHVVGTCLDVEKNYFRLTAAPDPSQVRPRHVLERSLQLVKRHWVDKHDYRYACDQLKSIRQDMIVQGVRDEFTIAVYETHARIALEKGDREEFHQCQSQLKVLYAKFPGQPNENEFIAYRLLYYISVDNNLDLATLLGRLSASQRGDECISYALDVRRAHSLALHTRLTRLCADAPRMAVYLMDVIMPRCRKRALAAFVKAYRPTLPVSFVCDQLGFADKTACRDQLLDDNKVIYTDATREHIDCKKTPPVEL